MRISHPVLIALLILPVGSVAAQQQQPPQQQQAESPAEAARRARDQKKDPAKPAKVWDNDNVPTATRAVNVVGKSPGSGSGAANQSANAQGAADTSSRSSDARSPKDTAAAQAQLASSKAHLQSLKADLDLLVRKFTLDSQTYFSNPNHASDKAGADAIADEQSQIEAKQQEVDAEQKKVDELAEKLRDSGASTEGSSSPQN